MHGLVLLLLLRHEKGGEATKYDEYCTLSAVLSGSIQGARGPQFADSSLACVLFLF